MACQGIFIIVSRHPDDVHAPLTAIFMAPWQFFFDGGRSIREYSLFIRGKSVAGWQLSGLGWCLAKFSIFYTKVNLNFTNDWFDGYDS